PATADPFPSKIDKNALTVAEPKRLRDKAHLKFVASQACVVCGRLPSDPHHLRFVQPRALGVKASDEFTVPLCRGHHRQLHHSGNEVAWWKNLDINALEDRQRTMGPNASKICACRFNPSSMQIIRRECPKKSLTIDAARSADIVVGAHNYLGY